MLALTLLNLNVSLEIFAKDKSGSDVEPPSTIEIFVDDINDNAPIFPESSYEFSVPEMSPKGMFLLAQFNC